MAENITINKRHVFTGSGAPQDSDKLCQDESQHPLKSVYIDEDTGSVYCRNAVNKVAADWQNSSGGSSSYLVYVAELTQTGTDAPAATNHQNTMGFGEWTRVSLGEYQSVSNVDYDLSKVWISGRFFGSSVIDPFLEFSKIGQLQYSFTIDFDNVGGKLAIYLTVNDDVGAEIDISSTGRDILLPEIRVYP